MLYRKTDYPKDPNISKNDLSSKVENMGSRPAPDGMLESPDRIYLTAIEKNAMVRFDLATRKVETVIEDKPLSWPDTLSWGPRETLYAVPSLPNFAPFPLGKSVTYVSGLYPIFLNPPR